MKEDFYLALLAYRDQPLANGYGPAQILCNGMAVGIRQTDRRRIEVFNCTLRITVGVYSMVLW